MSLIFYRFRFIAICALTVVLLSGGMLADVSAQKSQGLPTRQQVIEFLTQSVEWYRSSSQQRQLSIQPEDIPFIEDDQSNALQILRLSFDYSKALAGFDIGSQMLPEQPRSGIPDTPVSELQRLVRIEGQCEAEAQNARNNLESLRKEVERRKKARTSWEGALVGDESRLDLLQAQCQSYRTLLGFVRTTDASTPLNEDLASTIDDLSRTVPDLTNAGSATRSLLASRVTVPTRTGSSIPDLISDVLASRRKLETLAEASRSADRLAQVSRNLGVPLAQHLNSDLQTASLGSNDSQSSDLKALRQQNMRLDALSSEVNTLSPAIVALDKQRVLLGIYKSDVAKWRSLVLSQYTAAWKQLVLHLIGLGSVIFLLSALAAALRRFTARYIRDASRRSTILIAEWILLWLSILLVILVSFISNLASLATFLGLLTAGLAVALQNVILAVLGYAVLVGKLGLRLGDRVQISGVTGEVVEFGLLQFQVKEIDAEAQYTGRVASFSNSFVFLSPAIGIFRLGAEKPAMSFGDPR